MAIELLISALLVIITILIHYETLRLTAQLLPVIQIPPRTRILVAIVAAFMAHIVEVILYAAGFYVLAEHTGAGSIGGHFDHSAYDYLYYSITTYTSLGIGDVHPRGHLRFLTGIETLNGLMMITWSASFSYLIMEKFWGLHRKH